MREQRYYKLPTLNYNRANSVIIKYQPSIITERTALLYNTNPPL